MQDGVVKLNGTWFPLLTSDKAVFAEPARPKGTTGLHPKKKPPPPPPYPKPPAVEPPEDVFQHRTQAPAEQAPVADTVEDAATNTQPEAPPAEQAPAADKVEDAATNTQPEAQAQSESVPTTETHRTERPTPDVIPSATYAPPPPPESEYMQNTERPPSPPPEQLREEQRDGETQGQRGEEQRREEQRDDESEQPEELGRRKRNRRRYTKSNTWRTGIRNPRASHVLKH